MKKLLIILLTDLIAFVATINAQSDINSNKAKLERFKKYQISDNLIKDNWIYPTIGFNAQCDTIVFQGLHYDLLGFNLAFDKFISNKSKQDTIVIQLDFGDNVCLSKMYCSFDILANRIEKYSNNGIYYFSTFHAPKESISLKTDTLDLHISKVIEYNGKTLKYSDLSNQLMINKPELVILRTDKEVSIQDLTDILEITKKLMIKTILRER